MNNKTTLTDITAHVRNIETQSLCVIESCTKEQYKHSSAKHSSIGTHIRHIIEVIKELNTGGDSVNYDARARDIQIETDMDFARNQLKAEIKALLNKLETQDLEKTMLVNMDGMRANTTLRREVSVIISHTIHHLAFIKLVANQQNILLDENVGVAPATLEYQSNF